MQNTPPSTSEFPPHSPAPREPEWQLVHAYAYTDEHGELIYENCKLERVLHDGKREKKFQQRRPNPAGHGHLYNLQGVRRLPYRLSELIEAGEEDRHCTEGEKDADTLSALGLCATSISTPKVVSLDVFGGHHIIVHEDNDAEGRRKAKALATALVGIAASVRIVRYTELPEGGDVSDFIAKGHGLADVHERCDAAEEFQPPNVEQPKRREAQTARPNNISDKRMKAWVDAWVPDFFTKTIEKLCATKDGENRNGALNSATYTLYQLVARGWLDDHTVEAALREACGPNGNKHWIERRSDAEATFRRARADGLANPYSGDPAEKSNGHDKNGAHMSGHDRTASSAADNAPRVEVKEVDEDDDLGIQPWPAANILGSNAAYGIVGHLARLATKHSEADPIAVVASALAWGASCFGRKRYYRVGDNNHHARLFCCLVGESSRARKGTSFTPVERVFRQAESVLRSSSTLPFPLGLPINVAHGLSSGEGLIAEVRDQRNDDDDGWAKDKRLFVVEGEFGAVLNNFQRQGNTLSSTMRSAWDGNDLGTLTKNNRDKATAPHICILGHITIGELMKLLSSNDISNGVANRFIWIAVRRGRPMALPKPMADDDVAKVSAVLANIIEKAHIVDGHDAELVMSNSAQDMWCDCYPELSQDHTGQLGAVTSRAEAQVLRLAMTYAQLDGADRIELAHVEAALTFWRYAFDSAAYIFGNAELDPVGQKILDFVTPGQSRTQAEIVDLFGRNLPKDRLGAVLNDLQGRGRLTLNQVRTGERGRPKRVWSRT